MSKDSRVFTVAGTEYKVIKPTLEVLNEATKIRSKVFTEAFQAGELLRDQLENQLRKREMWNDELEIEYQVLGAEVARLTDSLNKGGIKLSEARSIAIEITEKRNRMVEMLSSRSNLDTNTCEGKADSARFNYLFVNCLVYNNDSGDKYFPNGLVDYLGNQEDPVALAGATEFYYLISNSEDPTNDLVENKFLKKYKFVDEFNRLIDKEGRLVNAEGRHIDEEGYFVEWAEDGTSTRVDIEGNPLTFGGVEFTPFLDDDGNPVIDEEEPKPKPRKRTPRKKKQSDS